MARLDEKNSGPATKTFVGSPSQVESLFEKSFRIHKDFSKGSNVFSLVLVKCKFVQTGLEK